MKGIMLKLNEIIIVERYQQQLIDLNCALNQKRNSSNSSKKMQSDFVARQSSTALCKIS